MSAIACATRRQTLAGTAALPLTASRPRPGSPSIRGLHVGFDGKQAGAGGDNAMRRMAGPSSGDLVAAEPVVASTAA